MTPHDPWAGYDEQHKPTEPDAAPLRLAFYGRCSTDDNQDPETSEAWQRRVAEQLVERTGGTIVAAYFDIGHSRSLPWKRRPEAQRLLEDLAKSGRGFDGIVVGEGQRCWFGSQFSEVTPVLEHHGITLYVPELGGAYDPKNPSHYTLMTLTGGMSRGERQRVQERVKQGMAAQVETQGRYLGGRPPYGYTIVTAGPHPNPRKAAEGFMLKRLDLDVDAAPVVRRIFDEVLAGTPVHAVVRALNTEGVLCPSAHDPKRNRHRKADGWQSPTVDAIVANPRYTGFATFGRFRKAETLVDPDDVTWGHKTRLVRSDEPLIRSREQAHPAIVTVDEWQEAQAVIAARRRGRGSKPRVTRSYALQSLLVCGLCGRRMTVERNAAGRVRFRCRARGLTGSAAAVAHPANVSVWSDEIEAALIKWAADLFSPERRESTIDALAGAVVVEMVTDIRAGRAHRDRADAQRRLDSLLDSLEAGVPAASVAPRIRRAQADLEASGAVLRDIERTAASAAPERADIAEVVEQFADRLDEVFSDKADPASVNAFWKALGLTGTFDHITRSVHAEIAPKTTNPPADLNRLGGIARVRGGT